MPRCRVERREPVVVSVNMLLRVEENSPSSGQKEGYLTYGKRALHADVVPAVVSARPLQSPLSNAVIWLLALHRPRKSGELMEYVVLPETGAVLMAVVHSISPAVLWVVMSLDSTAPVTSVKVTTRPW
jgi:hypothetical protein